MNFIKGLSILQALLLMLVPATLCLAQDPAALSADASLRFLRELMDRYHQSFPVSTDVSAPASHFVVLGSIGDSVSANGAWPTAPYAGASCHHFELPTGGFLGWGGFYFLNGVFEDDGADPILNWGTAPEAGIDLSEAIRLGFWVRGEAGQHIEFFFGGVSGPFPDSSPKVSNFVTLTGDWQQVTIDLSGLDLSYMLGGFGWAATLANNPGGVVLEVDEIIYELSPAGRATRLALPRFLRSFETLDVQPACPNPDEATLFDLAFRNLAFTYDNALVLLAFLANGEPDDLRRARLIGDAFVYAIDHDRFFSDGRLRSAYAAGDLALPPGWHPGGVQQAAAIPGFWCQGQEQFIEMEQSSSDVGNNAWAMIALLALYQRTCDTVCEPSYLNAARDLGQWIRGFRADTGTYQGFRGGVDEPEGSSPMTRAWASGEHNLDVVAAFRVLGALEGDASWNLDAEHAETLVDQLWDNTLGCYLAGTVDSETLNTRLDQLPLDVQTWSVLTLHDRPTLRPRALDCAEMHHRLADSGIDGFDFNTDRDGVWLEGLAQVALAYLSLDRQVEAAYFRRQLQQAQSMPPVGDGQALWAATIDGLTTGFDFSYRQRAAIASAAWNVFAQLGYDPYYQRFLPKAFFADGFESGDSTAWNP